MTYFLCYIAGYTGVSMVNNKTIASVVPLDYEPYPTLEIGKGQLVDVRFLFQVGGGYPLLVGRGKFPLVWMGALAQPGNRWISIVERNVSRQPTVSVNLSEVQEPNGIVARVEVTVGDTVALRVSGYSYDRARIDQLDLRPIGFSVFVDGNGVHAGGMTIGTLNVSNADAVFSFG